MAPPGERVGVQRERHVAFALSRAASRADARAAGRDERDGRGRLHRRRGRLPADPRPAGGQRVGLSEGHEGRRRAASDLRPEGFYRRSVACCVATVQQATDKNAPDRSF